MRFRSDGNNVYLHDVSSDIKSYMVGHMGASFSKAKNYCKLPRTLEVMEELFRTIPDIGVIKEFVEEGRVLSKEREKMMKLHIHAPKAEPGEKLRLYQLQDASFLTNVSEAGVFNEPRTGKTPTIIRAIRDKGTKRNLIVCPASLIWTWKRQIDEWYPESSAFVVSDGKKAEKVMAEFCSKSDRAHFLIVSKNRVNNMASLMGQVFDVMVVDEAHFLRNYGTTQSKSIFKIKARQRFALTGTPTVKHPSDIFGVLKFLFPQMFISFWDFAERYFEAEFNPFNMTGKSVGKIRPHREEELKKLVAINSISRKRKDVMPWLPDKNVKTVYAKMGFTQQKAYDEMRNWFTTVMDSGEEVDATNILTQLMRLRQIAIDPRVVGSKKVGCKTETLIQWLKDRDKPEPVVVMSMFTSYLNLLKSDLEAEGYKVGTITGEMTNNQKQGAADSFQAGELDVLLCNTISAGTGWTLDRGDTVIFMDNAWNPSDMEQAEDRVTPTTPDRVHEHNIIHIATMDSVDEKMFDIIKRKKHLTDILNVNARDSIREFVM